MNSSDTGKCYGYWVMSKNCSECPIWKDKEEQQNMIVFQLTINVLPNFEGSAGATEAAGVLQCFQESLDIHKVSITNFIGDGDSKSDAGVIKADLHPGVVVKRLEWVGHVQKRCGSRLRNLKNQYKDHNEKPVDKQINKYTSKLIWYSHSSKLSNR